MLPPALRRAQAAAVRRVETTPILRYRPLPKQLSVLASTSRVRLFRGGNQSVGKTTTGAVDLICTARNVHPWCPSVEWDRPEPLELWVLCASWPQSIAIQKKIYDLLPREDLHPNTVFDDAKGFKGKNPTLRIRYYRRGPDGRPVWDGFSYSIVRIKTVGQGGLNLSSATIQYAWFDEPPENQRVFSEIRNRVLRAGAKGRVLLTMTPVNAKVEWIAEEVERGAIEDHHARLEAHELIPVGASEPIRLDDGTPCDEAWIAAAIADTLPHEVPVVRHGEWRMHADAPRFPAFRLTGPDTHVRPDTPRGLVRLYLGIDHGVQTHTQTAVLVAVLEDADPSLDRVWVLAEYVGSWETTEDDDAEGILTMLEGVNVTWTDLDRVHGDRAHSGAKHAALSGKSNKGLMRALERHPRAAMHGIRPGRWSYERSGGQRGIETAKKGIANLGNSVDVGCTYLHRLMVRGSFSVHGRCEALVKAIPAYDGKQNTPESHIIDGLRYALKPRIFARAVQKGGRVILGT